MLGLFLRHLGGGDAGGDAVKAMLAAGSLSVAVKAFGLFKESAIAYYFGVSEYVDFYVLALVFVTFFVGPIGGALATLLTQKYIEICERVSQDEAANIYMKCQIFGMFCIMCIAAMQLGALQLQVLQTSFGNRFASLDVNYVLVLLPISLISLVSVINGSVLTAKGQFKAYSALPVLVPSSIIIALMVCPKERIFDALLLGTLGGFLLEMLAGGLCLRQVLRRVSYHFINRPSTGFRKIIGSMPPMVLSGVIMSGCLIVDQLMAVLAGEGAVAMINFGNRVALGLISIIAIFWTVLYPNFVKFAASADYAALRKSLWRFCGLGIATLAPLCGVLAYFSKDVIMLLFEHGAFLASDTAIVSDIQALYLLHIPLYALCVVCMRVANALENTKMLLWGNVLSLILNVGLNLYFIAKYGVIGVPLATFIAYGLMVLFWFFAANWLINRSAVA